MAEKKETIKTKQGTISATPEQAENFRASLERDKIQQERIATVKENARAMNRYREQETKYKEQKRPRERRDAGIYDASPTDRYGRPMNSFWAKEPTMPEMKPVPNFYNTTPEIPNFASKMMHKEGDLYDAIRRPYTYEGKYEVPIYDNRDSAVGPYAQNPAPSFPEFGEFDPIEYAKGVAQGGVRNYNPDYGLPYQFNETARKFWRDDSYFLNRPALDRIGSGYKLPFYLPSNAEFYPYKY